MVYSFCLAFKGPHPHRRFQVSRRPFCPLRPGAVRRESSLRCDLFSAWCTPSALRSKDHIRTADFKALAVSFSGFGSALDGTDTEAKAVILPIDVYRRKFDVAVAIDGGQRVGKVP